MTMIEIYHNPRCRKSREGLQFIKDRTDDFKVIEYLKTPLEKAQLKELLGKLDATPHEMIRTQEAVYKAEFKGKEFTDDEWIEIMVNNPKLINRPIVVKGNKAVWGVPAEALSALF